MSVEWGFPRIAPLPCEAEVTARGWLLHPAATATRDHRKDFMNDRNTLHGVRQCGVMCLALMFLAGTAAAPDPSAGEPAAGEEKETLLLEPVVDPGAKALLENLEKTYENLQSASFSGEIRINVDIPSDAHKTNQLFTSTYEAPNKFQHQLRDGLLMASNGGDVYIYDKEANSYLRLGIPIRKVEMRSLPIVVPQVLQSQNPSLLFAISRNGLREVVESFGEIKRGADQAIDGKTFQELVFCSDDQDSELHVLVDPKTFLIRRFTIDFKPALLEQGITNVQNAEIVVDYTESKANPTFPAQHFAWTPPEDAFDMKESAGAARPENGVSNLEGLPAPEFKLAGLDGRSVSLGQFKGKVVVLDFWATWAPDAAESLKNMAAIAKGKGGDLAIVAINLEEDPDKVKTFVELKEIALPVLLDDGRVAKVYEVKTIPQTIIIGRDGIVQKVFAGESPGREEAIAEAIRKARSQK